MGWRGDVCAIGVIKPPSPVIVQNPFRDQFDTGSLMTRIHKWSIVIYGSLEAKFIEIDHGGHIHRYGTPIDIVVYVSNPINDDNQILWRL